MQRNDVKGIQSAYDMYTSAHKDVSDAIAKTVADTQQAIQDANIANVMKSGVTDPSAILSTLQSQGYTDISLDDITAAIKNLSPDAQNIFAVQKAAAANGAPQSVLAAIGSATNQADALTAAGIYNTTMIPDLQKTAEANGAPQSVIDAIGQATDANSALQAAAGYTQTATGTLGDYLEYQRQAIAAGQVPEDYTTFVKAQQAQTSATAINQAVSIADQEAAYKAQVDTANGVLTPAQNTRVNDVVSQLNSNKDVQAFMSIAGQIGVLSSIPDGTQDPAQQSALLASVAHILSPNSSSLRGALNAIDPNSLDSGVYNTLKTIASTFSTVGKLSPDAVNNLKQIGTNEYNAYLTTYQSIRSAATAPLTSQGINVDNYIPDYSNINGSTAATLQAQSSQAAELISNFGSESANNAAILKQLASTMPNATTLEIAQTLGLIPTQ
jgi:hypothetical protein